MIEKKFLHPGLTSRLLITVVFVFLAFALNLSAQETGKRDRVTLSLKWLMQSQFAGYYAALDQGFYEEENIDLTIVPGAPDINPQSMVTAGVSDFGVQWIADIFSARDREMPVVSIAQIFQQNGLVLVSRAESGIETPHDFRGKNIGIWFFGNETQFYSLIRKLGIPFSSMNISPLKSTIRPFLDKSFDVITAMSYNEYLKILEAGYKREEINIISFSDYGMDFPGDALFTTAAMLENNPGLCARMIRASVRGWKWAMDNPEKAVDIMIERDRSDTLEKKMQMLQLAEITKLVRYRDIPLGYHEPGMMEKLYDTLLDNGLITGKVNLSDMYTNSILEMIPAEERKN